MLAMMAKIPVLDPIRRAAQDDRDAYALPRVQDAVMLPPDHPVCHSRQDTELHPFKAGSAEAKFTRTRRAGGRHPSSVTNCTWSSRKNSAPSRPTPPALRCV